MAIELTKFKADLEDDITIKDITIKYSDDVEEHITKGFTVEMVKEGDERHLDFRLIDTTGEEFYEMLLIIAEMTN